MPAQNKKKAPAPDRASVLDAAEHAEDSGGVFEFEHPEGSGRMYELPTALRFGVLRKAAKAGDDFAQMIAVLEAVADAEALAAIDDMTLADVQDLFTRWQEAIGASLGNSSASPA